MAFFCKSCSNIYDKSIAGGSMESCPLSSCNGENYDGIVDIINIDDMFSPIVQMLNSKGLSVNSCFFGNPNNNLTGNPFIKFDKFLLDDNIIGMKEFIDIFEKIPSPWVYHIDNQGNPEIYANIIEKNNIDRMRKILLSHLSLLSFVKCLTQIIY